jgi:hypothetical protein
MNLLVCRQKHERRLPIASTSVEATTNRVCLPKSEQSKCLPPHKVCTRNEIKRVQNQHSSYWKNSLKSNHVAESPLMVDVHNCRACHASFIFLSLRPLSAPASNF